MSKDSKITLMNHDGNVVVEIRDTNETDMAKAIISIMASAMTMLDLEEDEDTIIAFYEYMAGLHIEFKSEDRLSREVLDEVELERVKEDMERNDTKHDSTYTN